LPGIAVGEGELLDPTAAAGLAQRERQARRRTSSR